MIPPGTGDNCTGHCLARNSAPATEWGGEDGDALLISGRTGNGEEVFSPQGRWVVNRSRTTRKILQLSFQNFEDFQRKLYQNFGAYKGCDFPSPRSDAFLLESTPVNHCNDVVLSASLFLCSVCLQNVLFVLSFLCFGTISYCFLLNNCFLFLVFWGTQHFIQFCFLWHFIPLLPPSFLFTFSDRIPWFLRVFVFFSPRTSVCDYSFL